MAWCKYPEITNISSDRLNRCSILSQAYQRTYGSKTMIQQLNKINPFLLCTSLLVGELLTQLAINRIRYKQKKCKLWGSFCWLNEHINYISIGYMSGRRGAPPATNSTNCMMKSENNATGRLINFTHMPFSRESACA